MRLQVALTAPTIIKELKMSGQSKYELRYQDFSKEESSVGFNGVQMNAGNYAAQMILAHDLRTAVNAITIGALIAEKVMAENFAYVIAVPTDKNAQRERKWLVAYKDGSQFSNSPTNTVNNPGYGKKFTVDIPTADLALLPDGHSDKIDPDDAGIATEITDFITAFEAYQRSPYGGVAVVTQIVAVGRNL